MQRRIPLLSVAVLSLAWVLWGTALGSAAEPDAAKAKKKPTVVKLAGGRLLLTAPAAWQSKKPRSRIVEYEFATAKAEGDKIAGRVTIMGAGGGVDANIDRWVSQFSSGAKSKRDKIKVATMDVYLIDLSGTFKDRRGPFAPVTERKDYRMLGAIIVTEKLGQHFVKLYGPRKTVAKNAKAFKEMIKSLKAK